MLIMMINFMFLNSINPMMMGLMLIIQTTIMSLMMGKMNMTFWMSFIIFLVFIGGMLILFTYVILLINNNYYKTYNPTYLFISLLSIIINLKYNNNNETITYNNNNMCNNENSMNLMKLYNIPNSVINLMLVSYLFIMMIIISKITNLKIGPFYKF
uniref:NADH-ubiquinone oxidoreductase chain 6 n=1 Tax=Neomikiella lychnidis TaxID=2719079 RepID=A0A7L7S0H4_9DIPT|nr:NADH dehydrogenase subunit 6 [Neomikiella lychnidis]